MSTRRHRVRAGRAAWMAIAVAVATARPAVAQIDVTSPKRQVPDYDGRDPAPTTAGDVALWVPRVLLSPVYLTSEFVMRRPLAALIPAAERADLPRKLYDFFTFGPDHKAGFAPVAFAEFGFNPSVGIYSFWDDAFVSGHDLRLHAEAWPSDWIAGSLTERFRLDRDVLELRVSAVRRPDHVFYGLGPNSLQSSQSRYGEDVVNAGAKLDFRLWRASHIETGIGIRSARFYDGHYGTDPALTQEAATRAFGIPDGFERGYTAEYNDLQLVLDTRRHWPRPGSGLRLEAQGEQGSDMQRAPLSGWIRYGATAVGFYDLNDHGRVVSLSIATWFADPVGSRPVPFTELVTLGGNGPMRGFYEGRLVDRSAAVATARYVWPIAAWLYGNIQAAVGNVFATHLEGFKPGQLRFSGALGLSGSGSQDYPLELLVGFGTETFDHGAQPNVARIALGVTRGY
jgi:Omp85 superfamily domain